MSKTHSTKYNVKWVELTRLRLKMNSLQLKEKTNFSIYILINGYLYEYILIYLKKMQKKNNSRIQTYET